MQAFKEHEYQGNLMSPKDRSSKVWRVQLSSNKIEALVSINSWELWLLCQRKKWIALLSLELVSEHPCCSDRQACRMVQTSINTQFCLCVFPYHASVNLLFCLVFPSFLPHILFSLWCSGEHKLIFQDLVWQSQSLWSLFWPLSCNYCFFIWPLLESTCWSPWRCLH